MAYAFVSTPHVWENRMKRFLFIGVILGSIILAGTVFGADLKVYAGAGLIKPMEEMRVLFEKEHGCSMDVHYGSSGELFGLLSMGQPCDVLIPGAAKYTLDALKNGWIVEKSIHKLVKHVPVIVVPKGNPAHITSLEDLAKPGVRIAFGDPKGPAIGRVAKKILKKNKLTKQVGKNVTVLAPTVNQLLIYVALEQVDAGIIWGDLVTWAEGEGKVAVVTIDRTKNIIKTIPTALTTHGENNALAQDFNAFLASSQGMTIWKKWGFEPCAK